MQIIKPERIQPGDCIGFITPSSPLTTNQTIYSATKYFTDKGYRIKIGNNVGKSDRFLAGTDEERAEDFMKFFKDPDIKAVIALRGGQGSQRMLPYLDFNIIRSNPKYVVGFSDVSALQLGLFTKSGLVSLTGFSGSDTEEEDLGTLTEETLFACFNEKSYSVAGGITIKSGITEGQLLGGCLPMITTLIGTPYQPDFTNKILIIEDVWNEPFQIDGMISQLHLAGVFDKISGLIFGQFENCTPKHNPKRDGTVDDVIDDWSSKIKCPCLKNIPYGHIKNRCVLPIGGHVQLNADKKIINIL